MPLVDFKVRVNFRIVFVQRKYDCPTFKFNIFERIKPVIILKFEKSQEKLLPNY